MINSVVKKSPTTEDEFPKLMRHNDGTVILFSSPSIGVCVAAGGETNIGDYGMYWDMCLFVDFGGSITLSNED